MDAVEAALSQRARAALGAGLGDSDVVAVKPPRERPRSEVSALSSGLLDCLRHHLLRGETHYPDRPGMVELRRHVGAALPGAGYPAPGPDGVLITASEGESLFVTLLGLGAGEGTRFTGTAPGRHQRLFDWMGLVAAERGEGDAAGAFHYTEEGHGEGGVNEAATREHKDRPIVPEVPQVHAMGDRLFSSAAAPAASPAALGLQGGGLDNVIVIGSLDGLEAMHPFRLGFVAAPPKTLAGITKWKQASSICSPAPSQRAALWALGVRP